MAITETRKQKLVLVISILASFGSFLDGSVVNIALPSISRDLGGGLTGQQWVVDAYLITLGSLILIAGSMSDLYGRKKILTAGLIGFAAMSLLCAIAPTDIFLIISRALQGVAGALLVPSSLALIIANFKPGTSQSKAIGTWTAWTGISFIVGPFLGGFLVQAVSWRLIFAINIVPVAVTLWLLSILEQDKTETHAEIDIKGAILCMVGLGSTVFALIEYPHFGWHSPLIFLTLIIGLILLAIFVWYESIVAAPMLPLNLFKVRNFLFGNIATVAIYGGLSIATFLIIIFVQQIGGYKAIEAGVSLIPITIIMFFLSPRFGALSGKYGPRIFMTLGPIVAGLGFLYMLRVNQTIDYWTHLFPGIILFGLGLSITVAPLTAAVLGSIETSEAGIGSAINNAVARIAGLVAIAMTSLIVGSKLSVRGFHRGVIAMACLLFIGGIVSYVGIRNTKTKQS